MSATVKKLFIFLLLFVVVFGVTSSDKTRNNPIRITYFYSSPCASCEEGKKFNELFNNQLNDILVDNAYTIQTVNTFPTNTNLLNKMCNAVNVPIDQRTQPILFINEDYLITSSNIKANMRSLFLKQAGITSKNNINLNINNKDISTASLIFDESLKPYYNKNPQAHNSHIEYFYTSSCKDCESTLEFFKKLSPTYTVSTSKVKTNLSISYNNILTPKNLVRLKALFNQYNVPAEKQKVPILFYDKGYLSGYNQISQRLVAEIEQGNALNFKEIETSKDKVSINFTVFSIMFAGFMNGLNPCSVSMLLYLFSLLVAKKTNIIKISSFYIIGKSLSYFLIGFFVYYALNIMDSLIFKTVNVLISVILILLCLILFVLNSSDFIASKNENYQKIKLQLPPSLRKINHSIIQKFSKNNSQLFLTIGSFGLGFIISIGEFLCTGQIYIATILSLFSQSKTVDVKAILFLLLYIACMALPFIIFTIIIYNSKKVLELSEKFRKLMPFIKLINAVLFLGFGIFAILKLLGGL